MQCSLFFLPPFRFFPYTSFLIFSPARPPSPLHHTYTRRSIWNTALNPDPQRYFKHRETWGLGLLWIIGCVCRKESRSLGVVATTSHLGLVGTLARLLGVPFDVSIRSTKLDTVNVTPRKYRIIHIIIDCCQSTIFIWYNILFNDYMFDVFIIFWFYSIVPILPLNFLNL